LAHSTLRPGWRANTIVFNVSLETFLDLSQNSVPLNPAVSKNMFPISIGIWENYCIACVEPGPAVSMRGSSWYVGDQGPYFWSHLHSFHIKLSSFYIKLSSFHIKLPSFNDI
jgi:hypothetical protein